MSKNKDDKFFDAVQENDEFFDALTEEDKKSYESIAQDLGISLEEVINGINNTNQIQRSIQEIENAINKEIADKNKVSMFTKLAQNVTYLGEQVKKGLILPFKAIEVADKLINKVDALIDKTDQKLNEAIDDAFSKDKPAEKSEMSKRVDETVARILKKTEGIADKAVKETDKALDKIFLPGKIIDWTLEKLSNFTKATKNFVKSLPSNIRKSCSKAIKTIDKNLKSIGKIFSKKKSVKFDDKVHKISWTERISSPKPKSPQRSL
ncbi:hypothetical protein phytr_10920 [Candidatus Phycorickettsia trachydisci]|uniref:Uncharacterized protein n=1 Tax=Candidatus Phycorickettsia trachydisci TaxID=2115978 RepID=A0A2P1P9T3_9RICK|nr:hypothetical protein [Candidatus Phycorickettsia trachydisci]AVP88019.1 hypothetical protein phytr_10920 [Candidatus Phycorickettsia trachydisci]